MGENQAALKEWKSLYEDAVKFKNFACWQWMDDSRLFGIQDPESGETVYCSVMGALGEVFGLLVYLGSEGLAMYQGIQSGKIEPDDEDLHAMQKCLAITFDDRDMLDKKDLALIKTLGFKFRGRQEWPLFRSYLPGFVPWHLSGPEVRLAGLALRRTMEIAGRLREDPSFLDAPKKDHILVTYESTEGGKTVWQEKWVKPETYVKEEQTAPVDDVRLARIKAKSEKSDDSWEVDFFFAPFVVEEGDRPFFPYVALYVVHKGGYVLNFSMDSHAAFGATFQDNFLELLEKAQALPKSIMVKKDAAYDFFKPFADRLGVPLKKVKRLSAIEDAKDALVSNMAG